MPSCSPTGEAGLGAGLAAGAGVGTSGGSSGGGDCCGILISFFGSAATAGADASAMSAAKARHGSMVHPSTKGASCLERRGGAKETRHREYRSLTCEPGNPEHRCVAGILMAFLLAAPAGHRAKAERAEALGRMAEAAREYEAAWEEEQAPELLYRLGLARRKLKEYGKAREAFRAYLRAAPQGGLRDEVERQLAKLEILIEAQREDYSDAAPARKRSPPKSTPPAPERVVTQPAPIVAAPPPAPPAAVAAPAPELTLSSPVAPPARSRAPLWLASGAAAAFAGGAVLWWDGARVSRDLDARFAAGDLAAADRPLFGRARGESIAGRALVVAGAGLLAAAAVA